MQKQKEYRPRRRDFLAGAAGSALLLGAGSRANAQAAASVNLTCWSAAVDQVKSHATAFEKASGIRVNYENFPFAQYRTSVVTRLVGNATMDVLWVSDAWLPEFAEAQWLAPIDDVPQLVKYNAEAAPYCTASMMYKQRQYGLSYYGDHMSFVYNTEILAKAGFSTPPATWDEVVSFALKIKQMGIAEYPLLLALAIDTWLIEFVSTLTYSFGGRFVDDAGTAVAGDPAKGGIAAATWLRDAIHRHRILSPSAVETTEINALKALGSGQFAFAIVPTYRLRALNDPTQADAAGKLRPALMPKGPNVTGNPTCGWLRFYGMTPAAKNNARRRESAVKLMEFFGGRDADNNYTLQKMLLLDLGLPFCTTPLARDPEVQAFWTKWAGGAEMIAAQSAMAMKKDTIAPWFGEWNETSNQVWQSICLNRATPEAGMRQVAQKWAELKR